MVRSSLLFRIFASRSVLPFYTHLSTNYLTHTILYPHSNGSPRASANSALKPSGSGAPTAPTSGRLRFTLLLFRRCWQTQRRVQLQATADLGIPAQGLRPDVIVGRAQEPHPGMVLGLGNLHAPRALRRPVHGWLPVSGGVLLGLVAPPLGESQDHGQLQFPTGR